MQQLPLGVRLHDRATFAGFLDAAAKPAGVLRAALSGTGPRMLFVHGPEGSGKSHLLQACCAATLRSAYFPLLQLLDSGPAVFEGADTLALVAVDDLDAIAGEPGWERGLFKLYNDCESAGCCVVFSAQVPAGALGVRLADLASRLQIMLPVGVEMLDEGGRCEALQLHAAQRGLELPAETALYLQRHYPRDMKRLVALLDRLDAASLREQRRLTIPFIRQVISAEV
jgi:DnaA-homolog protein